VAARVAIASEASEMDAIGAQRLDQIGAVLNEHGNAALLRRQAKPLDDRAQGREIGSGLPAQQQAGDVGGVKRVEQARGDPLGLGGVTEPRRRQIEPAVQRR
jgi:hypothetical protein